jgi:hypothetical protein
MFGGKPKPNPEPNRCCENCRRAENLGPVRYAKDVGLWLCGWCWVNCYVYLKYRPKDRFL